MQGQTYRRLIELVGGRQAVQLLPVLCCVLTSCALAHDPQRRYTTSQSCDLVMEVGPVAFFNHVMGRRFYWVIEVVFIIVVIHFVGRRLSLPRVRLGRVGGLC